MNFFNRKPYRITRKGHSVFVKWLKPLQQWSEKDNDAYLPLLSKHIQASVDNVAWSLIGKENPSSDQAYREYVESVRSQLIEEFSLKDIQDEITIGVYHLGLLVLSIPTKKPEKYPYYYKGIQLKPYQ